MKSKFALLPLIVLVALMLACILSPQTAAFGPADISTLSAQTVEAIQQQTAAAQPGATVEPSAEPPAATAEPPAALPTNTPFPTVTNQPTYTPTATATPKPCNVATAIDVNVPDNWETTILDHFTKTWRFTNLGSCVWTSGYTLVFDHGDRMGAPDSVPVTVGTVSPGGTVDVSVNLLSPDHAGTFRGDFQLRAPGGTLFGHVWVQIKVTAPALPPPAVMPFTSSYSADVDIAPGAIGQTTAVCPAGTVVTSGGFATHRNVLVYTQDLNGNGWQAYGKNNDAISRTLHVYATCLTYPGTTTTHVWKNDTVPAGTFLNIVKDCPAGSIVTGGGFASQSDGSIWVYNSSQSGNGWQVYARNLSGSGKMVNAYAVCLSGAAVTTSQSTQSITVSAHSSGGSFYACPAGKVLTGGGWAMQNDLLLDSSYFSDNKWVASAYNTGAADRTKFIYGICMTLP
jgi:hypothetical protein